MANFSAIMILFRFYIGMPLLIVVFLSLAEGSSQSSKSKRQIYREQVLPSSGGKIPEAAFRADRLALNRLNKEGIAIPDGILLEHRHVHSHPHYNKHDPEDEDSLIKIIQTPDNRYTPPEGTYHDEKPLTVASTYLIRKPIGREETNIRVPEQQMPLHEILAHKAAGHDLQPPPSYHRPISQAPWRPPPKYAPVEPHLLEAFSYHPQKGGWPTPVSYQQHHQNSLAYYPIPVPFELPNKEVLKEDYFVKTHGESKNPFEEDIHGIIDWPYLLGRYTQLADEIHNGVSAQDSYRYSDPHSAFFSTDVLEPFESFYYTTRDRFIRKSKEDYAQGFSPPSGKTKESVISRKLVKLRCSDGHGSKCQVS